MLNMMPGSTRGPKESKGIQGKANLARQKANMLKRTATAEISGLYTQEQKCLDVAHFFVIITDLKIFMLSLMVSALTLSRVFISLFVYILSGCLCVSTSGG